MLQNRIIPALAAIGPTALPYVSNVHAAALQALLTYSVDAKAYQMRNELYSESIGVYDTGLNEEANPIRVYLISSRNIVA